MIAHWSIQCEMAIQCDIQTLRFLDRLKGPVLPGTLSILEAPSPTSPVPFEHPDRKGSRAREEPRRITLGMAYITGAALLS